MSSPASRETEAYLAWGRAHRHRHQVVRPAAGAALHAAVSTGRAPFLAHGRGRSYGDSCLNEGGVLLDTGRLDRFVAFDRATGLLQAQAGVRLAEVLAHVCRPAADGSAWFPPVVPGTRWLTLGGALANDVHGKNHHREGSFGCHVPGFTLLRGDGASLACSAERNPELYRATIGGLGLTGLVLDLKLQLRRVPGLMLLAEDVRMDSLDEFYALSAESEAGWEYSVAWVDCLATGRSLGRGIFSRANHAPGPSARPPRSTRGSLCLCPALLAAEPPHLADVQRPLPPQARLAPPLLAALAYAPALFPLDAIAGWNRLYGRQGFFQYQCVLPPENARDGVAEMLETVARAGEGSFLAVLKTMGSRRSPGLLSFPMPGTTLALDFPNRGAETLALLDRLDAITQAARGRVYPAKDGRMSPAAFAAGYPDGELARFRDSVDPAFSSSFWRRVGGGAAAENAAAVAAPSRDLAAA
jgi:FAD/FMN-containing dehydrogenase